MTKGKKTKGKSAVERMLSKFKPAISTIGKVYIRHALHVTDGWLVVYDTEVHGRNEQRTAYVQAADGHIKWDMINKAQI